MGDTRSATRDVDKQLLSGARRAMNPAGKTPRNRSTGLVILAALLVLGSGLAVAAWGLSAGQKATVLAVGNPIAKGQQITRDDLVTRAVAGIDDAYSVDQVSQVVGSTAAVDLVDRQILTPDLLTRTALPGPGQATVGLALAPERVPGDGLDPGDTVDVISTPASEAQADAEALDAPPVLAKRALVFGVAGDATGGGVQLVTLVVDEAAAARISAYSTAGRVAIVETSPVKAAN